MRSKRPNPSPTKIKVGVLTGGIRQDKPQLELNMGDLIRGINYQEVDGVFNGYKSIEGFEVFDGTPLASSVPITYADGVYDDDDREDARAAITPVGDALCSGPVLGCFKTDNDIVYAVRTNVEDDEDLIFKSSGTGWASVTCTAGLPPNGKYKFIETRFDLLTGLQRQNVVFFIHDGYGPCYIDDDEVVEITHADLPTSVYPVAIAAFKNRLWLGYSDGRLFFSNVGDPTDFDSTTFSGVIYLEDDIVDLQVTKGDVLVVFCKKSIQVIKALSTSDITDQIVVDYLFSNITLTDRDGAVEHTAQSVMDDIFYIDKRGLTSISTTQEYGDFETKSYSKGINKTLIENYTTIIGSFVKEEYNQYRLLFSTGLGIIFTFTLRNIGNNLAKVIKGITTFNYKKSISCVCDGYFGGTDGYIYKIDSGTSFNGEEIITTIETAYHHYNIPTFYKRFREVVFEGDIPNNLIFNMRASFDYRNTSLIPSTSLDHIDIIGSQGSIYGEAIYGTSLYGGTDNQTSTFYIDGYGTSMSLYITTSNKYVDTHTLSSMITQYSINGRRM